jgi:hypothetical protein
MSKIICPKCQESNNDINSYCLKCKTPFEKKDFINDNNKKEINNSRYNIMSFLIIVNLILSVILVKLSNTEYNLGNFLGQVFGSLVTTVLIGYLLSFLITRFGNKKHIHIVAFSISIGVILLIMSGKIQDKVYASSNTSVMADALNITDVENAMSEVKQNIESLPPSYYKELIDKSMTEILSAIEQYMTRKGMAISLIENQNIYASRQLLRDEIAKGKKIISDTKPEIVTEELKTMIRRIYDNLKRDIGNQEFLAGMYNGLKQQVGFTEEVIQDKRNVIRQEVAVLELVLNNFDDLDKDSPTIRLKNMRNQTILENNIVEYMRLQENLNQKVYNNIRKQSNQCQNKLKKIYNCYCCADMKKKS